MRAALLALLLTGCAVTIPGVNISDEERQECARSQDCTVWTEAELYDLLERVARKTYEKAFEHAVNGPD